MTSPYIADSLRRHQLERRQAKALAAVLNELLPNPDLTLQQKLSHLRWQQRTRKGAQRRSATRRARQAGATVSGLIDRREIIQRDQSICHLCGKTCQPDEIHLDHIIPLSRGGAHSPENIKVACSNCNLAKGAALLPTAAPPATRDDSSSVADRTHARTNTHGALAISPARRHSPCNESAPPEDAAASPPHVIAQPTLEHERHAERRLHSSSSSTAPTGS